MRRIGLAVLLLALLNLSACIAPTSNGRETKESAEESLPTTAPATEAPTANAQTEAFVFPFAPETDRSGIY